MNSSRDDTAPTTYSIEELKRSIEQSMNESSLHSLLYVARKLGEVDGIISNQASAGEALRAVQRDLNQLYDILIKDLGIKHRVESSGEGIGGDRA